MYEKIKKAVEAFDKICHDNNRFGAGDSEPNTVFRLALRRAWLGDEWKIPDDATGWQIFDVKGCEKLAKRMTTAAIKAVNLVESASKKPTAEINAYLSGRCGYLRWDDQAIEGHGLMD